MNFRQPRVAIVATWSVVGAFAVSRRGVGVAGVAGGPDSGSVVQTAAAWASS